MSPKALPSSLPKPPKTSASGNAGLNRLVTLNDAIEKRSLVFPPVIIRKDFDLVPSVESRRSDATGDRYQIDAPITHQRAIVEHVAGRYPPIA